MFVYLWCCDPPDFVVQINNFFSLVLFSAVIHKRRGKKLISKIIRYKLDRSSKMQFAFFILKTFKFFWKTIDFGDNLEMTQLWRSAYKNRYVDSPHNYMIWVNTIHSQRKQYKKVCWISAKFNVFSLKLHKLLFA